MKHKIVVEPPGQNARTIIDTMSRNCYNSTFVYPLVIEDGEGCYIKDVDGNVYLDFTSNIGSSPLGYKHPDVMDVLKEYSNTGVHKIAGQDFYCREHAELAERLLSIVPKGFKAFLINSGAEAVENAIKIAYRRMGALPGVSCINAFHGRTLGALTFTFSKPVQKSNFPELPVKRIKFCSSDDDPEIDAVENLLKENKVAFIITEIVQGEGGYNVASKRFIKMLREYTSKYGVPLIIDEVQSGMGRTGRWWAFEHYGVEPDIMAVAKALQVGATLYRRELDPGQQGVLSSTWGGGSRIDLAVGAKIIDVIRRDNLLSNAERIGGIILKALRDMADDSNGKVVDVRGIGLMIGVEFISKEVRDSFIINAFKHGLLLLPAGIKVIRVIPPLIIREDEVQEGVELMYEVLKVI
ncbi:MULTISPECIES: aminotransferase class III-fold pyridoxal phosphate-dependent enzyme [Candidatus Nitrosocaldus]|uniref:Acetylornithine aminotransferase n=1 Tax=Candidatus Nitrosocaldus cavascurensis TaxID=2058097 RepID=A0A2K5ASS8_9ARCH|nr:MULTISPECIES: aminotransferase class III-fold pyridoxal phosphate-dependent enzyme [Candidatus Nitrosocaldus]SPC34677.1 Acetylornithine aminotransferase [Candidatus Nitrosocaldus cavascurensis]